MELLNIDDVRVVDLGEHNNRSVDISYNGSSRTLLDQPGASVQMALTDSSIVLTAVVKMPYVGTSSKNGPKWKTMDSSWRFFFQSGPG